MYGYRDPLSLELPGQHHPLPVRDLHVRARALGDQRRGGHQGWPADAGGRGELPEGEEPCQGG